MFNEIKDTVVKTIQNLSAEFLGWIAVMLIHSATIPTYFAVMQGLTDRLPQVDIIIMIWFGLALLFLKSIIQKDMLNIITIGFGFIVQAVMLSLIFIK